MIEIFVYDDDYHSGLAKAIIDNKTIENVYSVHLIGDDRVVVVTHVDGIETYSVGTFSGSIGVMVPLRPTPKSAPIDVRGDGSNSVRFLLNRE